MRKVMRLGLAALLAVIMMLGGCTPHATQTIRSETVPAAVSALSADGAYVTNVGKLQEEPFVTLPLGAVKPDGWLADQLTLQAENFTAELENYATYTEQNGWLGGNGDAWEKGPYYTRGLVATAYVSGNKSLKSKARKWIDWAIKSQDEDGAFGPRSNNDWWARMPMLTAIRDYYEALTYAGGDDARVLPFYEKYFRYQLATLPDRPLDSWGAARAGDNMEIVYWYYNKIYDASQPSATDWLLDLAALLAAQATDWVNEFHTTTVREHVVNTTQAWKMPILYAAQLTDPEARERARTALESAIRNIGIDHGRIDGLPNADEGARDNKATRGTELCSIGESLISLGIAADMLDEAWVGDMLEKIAYNALPAAYAPDYRGHVYYISQNQVLATPGSHGFEQDHGDDLSFGAPTGFECCFPNGHIGWPKFIQNMWKATVDGGLAAVAYGPNTVTARVQGGATAVFRQTTSYPFETAVRMDYEGDTAEFPLKLRIPEWCDGAIVTVNGREQNGVARGQYFTVSRTWRNSDVVEIVLPMDVRTSSWAQNTVGVERGPLIYSLKIEEQWTASDDANRGTGQQAQGNLAFREVTPASAWNYGLILSGDANEDFTVTERGIAGNQPFTVDAAPVVLRCKGQLLPDWRVENNVVAEPTFGPYPLDENAVCDVELIPYACGRLRISQIPRVGTAAAETVRNGATTFVRKLWDSQNERYADVRVQAFDNLVVRPADDYTLTIRYSGSGTLNMQMNTVYERVLPLPEKPTADEQIIEISGLKQLIADKSLAFTAEHYNSLRFYARTGDATITQVVVTPTAQAPDGLRVSAFGGDRAFTVTVAGRGNSFVPYTVSYGTSPDTVDCTASGFRTGSARITGLTGGTYYYRVQAVLDGKTVTTQPQAVAVTSSVVERPAVTPTETIRLDTFDGNIDGTFHRYGASGKIGYRDGKLVLDSDPNVKAMLTAQGSGNWTDYVVETALQVTDGGGNGGLIFRVSDVTDAGPDSVTGYYFGIDSADAIIGYMNGSFREIIRVNGVAPAGTHTLRVIAAGNDLLFAIDGAVIFACEDDKNAVGGVGFRSYNRRLEVSTLQVRALDDSDRKLLETGYAMDVTAVRSYGLVQLKYRRMGNVTYKVLYGTESGKYTQAACDIRSNLGYAYDRMSVSGLDNDVTYYMKVVAVNDNGDMCASEELVLTPYDENDVAVRQLSITGPSDPRLSVGETLDLDVAFAPVRSQRDVVWRSSDPTIVEVDANGKVTAKKAGLATVTVQSATSNSDDTVQSATVRILVTDTPDTPPAEKIGLSNGAIAGISIASTFAAVGIAIAAVWLLFNRKHKKADIGEKH